MLEFDVKSSPSLILQPRVNKSFVELCTLLVGTVQTCPRQLRRWSFRSNGRGIDIYLKKSVLRILLKTPQAYSSVTAKSRFRHRKIRDSKLMA